jgi:serine/threonine-protein kinase
VAVKVLYAHLCEPEELERFRREAELAGRLPEGRAARVLDFGRSQEGYHYMAMELLPGEDLGTHLRRVGRLDREALLSLADGLAAALDDAHDSGVIHRDLKPSNVFLVERKGQLPVVTLLDFGLARLITSASRLTQTAAVMGTPGYLAPEQAAADFGDTGPHTDVFAFGAILYRAVTGQNAFPSRHPAAAIYEAVHVDPATPSSITPELHSDVDLVLRLALAKRASERYARAGELARDLRLALDGKLADETRARAARVARTDPSSPALERTLADHRTPSRR